MKVCGAMRAIKVTSVSSWPVTAKFSGAWRTSAYEAERGGILEEHCARESKV
jgi:hypothetical protein